MTKRSGENLTFSSEEKEIRIAVEFYNKAVASYKTLGPKAVKQVQKWNKILRKIEDKNAFVETLLLFHEAMLKEMRGELPPPQPQDQDGPQAYDTMTLENRRGKFLYEYCEKNKIKSIKTGEARAVLQTAERSRLHPQSVIRAIKAAAKWGLTKIDHIGGRRETRLRIIQPTIIKKDEFFNRPDLNPLLRLEGI